MHFTSRHSLTWSIVAATGLGVLPAQGQPTEPTAPPVEEAPPTEEVSDPDQEHPGTIPFAGIVIDAFGSAVPGARISIPSLGIEVTASATGEFEVVAPSDSEHEVVVVADGFVELRETVVFDESTALSGLELLVSYESEEITVTGTRRERTEDDTPVRTQIVSRDAVERRGATNLAEALDQSTGLRVESNCQNCGFTQLRLNGLEGHHAQILIDGRPVMSSLAGVYVLEQLPQEMIERVEVVKGGGSALYGGNAVAGVVNVVTRRPRRSFGSVNLRGGLIGGDAWEERISATAGLVSPEKTFALHLFGNALRRNEYDANGDGYSEIGRVRQNSFGATSFFAVIPDGELRLELHSLREHRRGGDDIDEPEFQVGIAEGTRTDRIGGSVRWEHLVNEAVSYDVGYSLAYTERQSYYGGGGDVEVPTLPADVADLDQADLDAFNSAWEARQAALGAYGRTENPVHTVDGYVNLAAGTNRQMIFTVGTQYTCEKLRDEFPVYSRVIDEQYDDIGLILQHDWLFSDWGESILGVRVDKHSELDDVVASPRASLMLDPLDWLKLRTSLSSGFRAPQVFDEDLHITIVGGEGQIIRNAAGLDPERAYSASQQFESHLEVGKEWDLKVGFNGYYTLITNAHVIEEQDDPATPDEIEFERRNRGETTVLGAEIDLSLQHANEFGVAVGATRERAENDEPDEDFDSRQIFRTPAFYGYAEVFAYPTESLRVSTTANLTGPMDVPHYAGFIPENRLEESDPFLDWGVNVSYRVDLRDSMYVRPYVGVRNILNSYQDDFDVGPDRDAGYVYGPRLPRSILLGVEGGI